MNKLKTINKFNNHSTFQFGIQMLDLLENLHDAGYGFNDIYPGNIALIKTASNPNTNTVIVSAGNSAKTGVQNKGNPNMGIGLGMGASKVMGMGMSMGMGMGLTKQSSSLGQTLVKQPSSLGQCQQEQNSKSIMTTMLSNSNKSLNLNAMSSNSSNNSLNGMPSNSVMMTSAG